MVNYILFPILASPFVADVSGFLIPSAPLRGEHVGITQIAKASSPAALFGEASSHQSKGLVEQSKVVFASMALVSAIALSPPMEAAQAASAYSDYASDTVENVISRLKSAGGNRNEIYQVYEELAEIIAEGKGIGGAVDYKGVQLERGYVADEDTSIYNPGLTLLTEGEKEKLVEGLISSREAALKNNQWNDQSQLAYSDLKTMLDPLHMNELRGYLGILPVFTLVVYVGVLAIQQIARDFFEIAYIAGAAAIFLPFIALVAFGS